MFFFCTNITLYKGTLGTEQISPNAPNRMETAMHIQGYNKDTNLKVEKGAKWISNKKPERLEAPGLLRLFYKINCKQQLLGMYLCSDQ